MNTYKTSLAIKIEVTVDFDLTDCTEIVYLVSKPDGTTVTWTATIDTAATGITSYTTTTGDLADIGTYVLQPKATFSGKLYFGDPISFDVNQIIT
jgi:hypothetical protein